MSKFSHDAARAMTISRRFFLKTAKLKKETDTSKGCNNFRMGDKFTIFRLALSCICEYVYAGVQRNSIKLTKFTQTSASI